MSDDCAFLELLAELQSRDYRFIAVTPGTHQRVLARSRPQTLSLRDIFGWNRPFEAREVEPAILELLRRANALEKDGDTLRSRLRVASVGDHLFLHSSFPTEARDSVFFGPDTYRFCSFIGSKLAAMKPPSWIVDMGAGSGAGGIITASEAPAARLTLVDINPAAARLASINARFAGVTAKVVLGERIPAGCDLVIANPPYMIDSDHRTYRDGRGVFGGEITLDWARQALTSLTAGGTLLLYTGAAVINGAAPLLDALRAIAASADATFMYSESDPDLFGEELSGPAYSQVERIAAVGITLVKCSGSFRPKPDISG